MGFYPVDCNNASLSSSFDWGIKARIYFYSAMAVLRKGQEIQVTQQGSCLNGIGMGKQRESSHHYLPPEMGLPQDWTYWAELISPTLFFLL
jgi:hypothetical protein